MAEREEEDSGIGHYATPMQHYGSSIIKLTNPERELYKLELTFRSMIEDSEGNLKQLDEPLMNDLGINSVIGTIQTIVSQTTILSNLEDKHIEVMIEMLADTLAKDLMVNRIRYNIRNSSTRSKIMFTAVSTSFICLRRAWKGDDKRFWGRVQQDIRMESVQSGKGSGLFGGFNPFKKKE